MITRDRIAKVLIDQVRTNPLAANNIATYALHRYLRTSETPEFAFDNLPPEYRADAYAIAAALRSADRYATGQQYPDTTRSDLIAADTILTALRHTTTEATR